MSRDDLMANREPQAGAIADGLGREKRIEQSRKILRGNATAVIRKGDYHHTVSFLRTKPNLPSFVFLKPSFHRLCCVDKKIQKHLADLRGDADQRRRGLMIDHHVDAMAL